MNKDKNEWKKQYIQSKCQVIKNDENNGQTENDE